MASKHLHLAAAEKIMEQVPIQNKNRFCLGCASPDAHHSNHPKRMGHLKISVCGNSKMTYDLDYFISLFKDEMKRDELYIGYYLHLVQDLVFREFIYNKCNSFDNVCERETSLFTEAMSDRLAATAAAACIRELHALAEGRHDIDAYRLAWRTKPFSLLQSTQNTRDLGGYRTEEGILTKDSSLLRSDIPESPIEEDFEYLQAQGITTIIDMRGQMEAAQKPNAFAKKEGFTYFNFQINEGSLPPKSTEAVPGFYMDIAASPAMPDVFHCIANAASGVMFHCAAGKDRTGVVSAILLNHAGVNDKDIIENYLLTKEYGKKRLALAQKNFPKLDMAIITPCEAYMKNFLKMFREKYGTTAAYFKTAGLNDTEIQLLREKLGRK